MTDALDPIAQPGTPLPWRTVEITAEESELGPRDFNEPEGIPHTDLYATVVLVEAERSEPGLLVGRADYAHPRNVNVSCLVGGTEQDHAYILAACNAYPGLVAALREARQRADEFKVALVATEAARAEAHAETLNASGRMMRYKAERDALKAGLRDVLAYVDASPCDPDITAEQRATWPKVAPARALLSGEPHP